MSTKAPSFPDEVVSSSVNVEAPDGGVQADAVQASGGGDTHELSGVGNASVSSNRIQLLSVEPDGSRIEVHHMRSGGIVAQVVRKIPQSPSPKTIVLGEIKTMVDARGIESLRGNCKSHSKCICWIRGSHDADLLLQWLAKGHTVSKEQHAQLSIELKQSLGMKVRNT